MSCTYLVYDPWSRELSYANAGHDAPLLVTERKVGQMEIADKGLLLGVRGRGIAGVPAFREESMVLPPGATLVFYTDGLTDRRVRADGLGHYTEDEALEMLRAAVGMVAYQAFQPSRRSPRRPRRRFPATSTTTWRSWWSSRRRRTWPPGKRPSLPSRSRCRRPARRPCTR